MTEQEIKDVKVQIYDLAEEVNRLELEKQNKIAEIDKLRKSLETREE